MPPHKVALHVFYGIPCSGKSTKAITFAQEQGIRTLIHTDYIREVQRGFVSVNQIPALSKVTHTAWELHGPPTRHNIIAGFLDHVAAVTIGVSIVVTKLVRDGFDAVIDGAHFHSGVLDDLRSTHSHAVIDATLLTVQDAAELALRIKSKEQQRAATAEPKGWQNNIPILLTLQDYLIADARAHNIPIAPDQCWRHT